MKLVFGFLLSIACIILTANLAWWFVIKTIGPILELARDIIRHDSISALQRRKTEQMRLLRELQEAKKFRNSRKKSFVTPSGKKVILDVLEQNHLKYICLQELRIEANANWETIKKAWRKQAKIYHPDRGGSQAMWLRKLRAYEALEQLHEV